MTCWRQAPLACAMYRKTAVLVLVFLFLSPALRAESRWIVKETNGTVEWSKAPPDWRPARPGKRLQWGDHLKVGDASQAVFKQVGNAEEYIAEGEAEITLLETSVSVKYGEIIQKTPLPPTLFERLFPEERQKFTSTRIQAESPRPESLPPSTLKEQDSTSD